jgi:hypothetical protein
VADIGVYAPAVEDTVAPKSMTVITFELVSAADPPAVLLLMNMVRAEMDAAPPPNAIGAGDVHVQEAMLSFVAACCVRVNVVSATRPAYPAVYVPTVTISV